MEQEPVVEVEQSLFSEMNEDPMAEVLWKAKTGLNEETLCAAIETLIFMSDRPLSLQKLRKHLDEEMPLRILHESIQRLQAEYESAHHGLRLVEVAEGYQFRTKATYSRFVQSLFKVNSLVLSPTALEVLAIIAYKQPVSKVEVEKIRGVDSSHIVRALMDKRLVKVVGRADEMGRPVLYGTTPEFLEVFNLRDLEELPPEHELQTLVENNQLGEISDIKNLVAEKVAERFTFDEIGELDELQERIKTVSTETPFTKSLKFEEKKRVSGSEGDTRTSFEVLEDYIQVKELIEQNKLAAESEMIISVVDPLVVNVTEGGGPFNAPEFMDDESFENLDADVEEDELLYAEKPADEAEKLQLSEALDKAFAKLTETAELPDSAENLEEGERKLDETTRQVIENAKDLGLDLDFLESGDKNNPDPSSID